MKHRTRPVIVGHRGAHGTLPGNTRASFEKAIQDGVAEIETDCRLTSDGVIVQLHDDSFRGSGGSTQRVADTPYAELKTYLPAVMTLAELIELVNRRARLMLEIKRGVDPRPIIQTIQQYLRTGWQPSDFSIASFEYSILQQAHQALPEVDRIVLEPWLAIRAVRRARQLDTPYLSMNQQYLWWGFIRWASQHHHKVYSYPFPRTKLPFNHKKPQRWIKHGLHGIITDHPDMFR